MNIVKKNVIPVESCVSSATGIQKVRAIVYLPTKGKIYPRPYIFTH